MVVFAVFDVMKQLLTECAGLLDGKVVADPSNPIGFTADGEPFRTSPKTSPRLAGGDGPARRRALRQGVRTLSAGSLATSANRAPRRAVLFYASDDNRAFAAIEGSSRSAGLTP